MTFIGRKLATPGMLCFCISITKSNLSDSNERLEMIDPGFKSPCCYSAGLLLYVLDYTGGINNNKPGGINNNKPN